MGSGARDMVENRAWNVHDEAFGGVRWAEVCGHVPGFVGAKLEMA